MRTRHVTVVCVNNRAGVRVCDVRSFFCVLSTWTDEGVLSKKEKKHKKRPSIYSVFMRLLNYPLLKKEKEKISYSDTFARSVRVGAAALRKCVRLGSWERPGRSLLLPRWLRLSRDRTACLRDLDLDTTCTRRLARPTRRTRRFSYA